MPERGLLSGARGRAAVRTIGGRFMPGIQEGEGENEGFVGMRAERQYNDV